MRYPLSVDVYCSAGVGDLVGRVSLADGTDHDVVLAGGVLDTSFEARPVRLTIDGAASGIERTPPSERERPTDAATTHADAVFDQPLDVPASGRLALDIVWGCECHGELHVRDGGGKFGSFEHVQCAYWVGYDGIGKAARPLAAPIEILHRTPLDLVAGRRLMFGEIVCLAGDFFAHLDRESATMFADAWPALESLPAWLAGSDYRSAMLAEATAESVTALLEAIHGEGTGSTTALDNLQAYPNRRYYALASQNFCHFGADALALYRRYHELACKRAEAAGEDEGAWMRAVVTEAFACHFLTDLFATGHMRTPRRALGERFGIARGALWMSKRMHDEDNRVGLWCTTTGASTGARVVWRAFGDGRLVDSPMHLRQVQEAVRRSFSEVCEANARRAVASDQRAEQLIPTPLPPWTAPLTSDVLPDGTPHPADQMPLNHAPMYMLLPNGHIGKREGGLEGASYRDLEG